ncbi:DUF1801 domain-containing protein [Cellulomonas xiejunii]|uniref:DUF1801 domain-containing protein n=1 Tax=Cellulomonas xiejunii TaxID=2968083 RepID=A0ABY5KRF3_9CELL|nr:DUF1801 domain-containing protein [Cellulomonas xiejunii]MCC2313614.1 DUF1801 domain-containing protein [Cellulomonas xiejunii]MCC2321177.1 DUF1801 domain-containing protein [Cellulomonas xiejunii]UUI71767.1 DUF1801 domain-containing protein [Cellulomonas xiejunii]
MTTTDGTAEGFTEQERAAIKERAAELRTEKTRGRGNKKAADELDVLAKIQKMSDADRPVAERIHAIVTTTAPDLAPKLWYGQPAYARNGKVVCFFRSGDVDKERYSTFGFTTEADLDDDTGVWPTSFAVSRLTPEAEATLTALVARVAV